MPLRSFPTWIVDVSFQWSSLMFGIRSAFFLVFKGPRGGCMQRASFEGLVGVCFHVFTCFEISPVALFCKNTLEYHLKHLKPFDFAGESDWIHHRGHRGLGLSVFINRLDSPHLEKENEDEPSWPLLGIVLV